MRRLVVGLVITLATIAPAIGLADDPQIAKSIAEALKSQKDAGNLHGFKINLEVDNGTVWLKGHVNDDEQKALAARIAESTTGVEQVVNDLKVEHPTASPRKFNLSRVAPLRMLKPRAEQPEQPAVESTRRQPRVDLAAAQETAQPAQPVIDDEAIAKAIFSRLSQAKQSGQLRNFKLDMNVKDGIVWLNGQVSSAAQKNLALDIAARTNDVVQVVDQVAVRSVAAIPASTGQQQPSSRRSPQVTRVANAPASPIYHAAPTQAAVQPQLQAVPVQQAVPQMQQMAQPMPVQMMGYPSYQGGIAAARYDHPNLPQYAWPSYAAHPNYGAVTYPQQYSPAAWPYIGPFYPYPQVPLGWRKVELKWKDGWWMLDFKEK